MHERSVGHREGHVIAMNLLLLQPVITSSKDLTWRKLVFRVRKPEHDLTDAPKKSL
jgi:hypothetical protein